MNIELLRKARAILAAIPDEHLKLEDWVNNTTNPADVLAPTCGTIACAAGWLAGSGQIPGLSLHVVTEITGTVRLVPWPDYATLPQVDEIWRLWDQILRHLAAIFDITPQQADGLFNVAGDGEFDDYLLEDNSLSDKDLALARFDCLLSSGGVA